MFRFNVHYPDDEKKIFLRNILYVFIKRVEMYIFINVYRRINKNIIFSKVIDIFCDLADINFT